MAINLLKVGETPVLGGWYWSEEGFVVYAEPPATVAVPPELISRSDLEIWSSLDDDLSVAREYAAFKIGEVFGSYIKPWLQSQGKSDMYGCWVEGCDSFWDTLDLLHDHERSVHGLTLRDA